MTSFAGATSVSPLSPTSYSANFPRDWCTGAVLNGGYLASTILTAAALHSSLTLPHLSQPHVIAIHLTFLRRTSAGPAEIRFKSLKLGKRTSNLAVSVVQRPDTPSSSTADRSDGKESAKNGIERRCISGTLILSNLATEAGLSLPTHWTLSPPPAHLVTDFAALLQDKEQHYVEWRDTTPHPDFRRAGRHLRMFVARDFPKINLSSSTTSSSSSCSSVNNQTRALIDQYITFRDPSTRFTNATLGYVVDMFPQLVETMYPHPLPTSSSSPSSADDLAIPTAPISSPLWYPTLLLNLDIRRLLPPEGVKWLFVRVQSKAIERGRMDLEVLVMDPLARGGGGGRRKEKKGEEEEGMQLVASSQHVALVLGSERNMAGREAAAEGKKDVRGKL